jgi:hypothetical protein
MENTLLSDSKINKQLNSIQEHMGMKICKTNTSGLQPQFYEPKKSTGTPVSKKWMEIHNSEA